MDDGRVLTRRAFAGHALIRTAGMPFGSLERFASTRALAVARELDRIAAILDERRERLCDRLHGAVQGEPDKTLRKQLLDLKRCVFNDRVPPPRTNSRDVALAAANDPCLGDDLVIWEASVREYDGLLRDADRAMATDWNAAREELAKLWTNPALQNGVLFAQPQLHRDITSHFESPRTQKALLAYCYRMATKTTPFSSFTETAIATLDDDESDEGQAAAPCSRFTLNARVVQQLAALLLAQKPIASCAPLFVNATTEFQDDCVHFLACRPPDESIVSLTMTKAIGQLLAFAAGSGRCTAGEAARHIADTLQLPVPRVERLVTQLIESGVLQRSLDYDDNDPRALGAIAASIARVATDTGRNLGDELREIQRRIDTLDSASVPGRAATLADVMRRVAACREACNGGTAPLDEQGLVNHRFVAGARRSLRRAPLGAIESALGRICGVLPLFNADLRHQERVTDRFLSEYGASGICDSVMTLFRQTADAPEQPCGARAARAHGLRNGLVTALRRQTFESGACTMIPDALLDEWSCRARSVAPPLAPPSVACLGHLMFGADRDEPARFVLDKIAPGYGVLFARYAGAGAPGAWLGTSLARGLARLDPCADVVELIATFGFDEQIRPRVTDACLRYPGDARSTADTRTIPWSDVAIRYDDDRQAARLWRKSTGRPLLPVHLGTLSPIYFPPFYRFITAFGPALTPDLPLLDVLDAGAPSGEIRHYRRVEHGAVIVMRETWRIPIDEVPRAKPNESDFSLFRRLRHWAARLGLPRRVFVTPMRVADYLASAAPDRSFRRLHKPFYVDWDDFFAHQLFRRFVRVDGTTITIAEMLPVPEGGSRATDHVFEIQC